MVFVSLVKTSLLPYLISCYKDITDGKVTPTAREENPLFPNDQISGKMLGWKIPPPKKSIKTKEDFQKERWRKVEGLIGQGLLKPPQIRKAMLKVPREDFIPEEYRDYAYREIPLILPGGNSTISCPHSYPLFYEALELKEGNKFLEVGAGSRNKI